MLKPACILHWALLLFAFTLHEAEGRRHVKEHWHRVQSTALPEAPSDSSRHAGRGINHVGSEGPSSSSGRELHMCPDGGMQLPKHLSSLEALSSTCSVLCMGSDGSSTFESSVLARTPCQVDTFECTLDAAAHIKLRPSIKRKFHDKCINAAHGQRGSTELTFPAALSLVDQARQGAWRGLSLLRVSPTRFASYKFKQAETDLGCYCCRLPCRIDILKVGGGYTEGHEMELALAALRHGWKPQHIAIQLHHAAEDSGHRWGISTHHGLSAIVHFAKLGYGLVSLCQSPTLNTTELFLTALADVDQSTPTQPACPNCQLTGQDEFGVPALAGHYQVHSHPKAVREVLRKFRTWYPDAPVYMVNDGGDKNLEGIAAEFGANYTYAEHTVDPKSKNGLYMAAPDTAIKWLQRIIRSAAYADWVLLLEDDVMVVKPVSVHLLKYDICGSSQFGLPPEVIKLIERLRGYPLKEAHVGGMGGAIVRGSFLRALARREEWKQHVNELHLEFAKHNHTLASDQLITSLVYAAGGTVGPYPGYAEKWQNDFGDRMQAGTIEVVHQEKGWYQRL